jgi:hypothetical protein
MSTVDNTISMGIVAGACYTMPSHKALCPPPNCASSLACHASELAQLATQHCTSQWFSGNAALSARAAKAVVQTTLPLYQDPKPVSCNKTALLQACYALHLLITIMPLPVCWPHMKPPRQHLTTIDLHPPQHNCTTNTVNYMLLICRPTPTLVMLSGLP